MRTLAVTVHVQDPETGRHVVFHKGSQPPKRVVDLITNPDVWESEPEGAEDSDAEPEAPTEENEVQSDSTNSGEPPRSGRGSSREVWAAFAADRGVHAEEDDTRDDIIAALVSAGVIEE